MHYGGLVRLWAPSVQTDRSHSEKALCSALTDPTSRHDSTRQLDTELHWVNVQSAIVGRCQLLSVVVGYCRLLWAIVGYFLAIVGCCGQ